MRYALLISLLLAMPVGANLVFKDTIQDTLTLANACTNELVTVSIDCNIVATSSSGREQYHEQCTGTAVGETSGDEYVFNETVVIGSGLDFQECRGTEYLDLHFRLINVSGGADLEFRARERCQLQPQDEFCLFKCALLELGSECRGID
ncbi:MAG TPA: hypothetical protein VEO54_10090 [Thermoanaerobaculia bacterium]|nr:hypothetical protein [Thermoanaerobaculia bacterium]